MNMIVQYLVSKKTTVPVVTIVKALHGQPLQLRLAIAISKFKF